MNNKPSPKKNYPTKGVMNQIRRLFGLHDFQNKMKNFYRKVLGVLGILIGFIEKTWKRIMER